MAYENYEKFIKSKEVPKLFTLKEVKGLSSEETLMLACNVQTIANSHVLPTNTTFDTYNEEEKRTLLSNIFNKSPYAYEYTKKLYKKYLCNMENTPTPLNVPYYAKLTNNRDKIFQKSKAIAFAKYIQRTYPNTSAMQDSNSTPTLYLDDINYFPIMQKAKKYQLYNTNEAKNISEIVKEYKSDIIKQYFNTNKNKVFYFPIDAVDDFGRYYTMFKQVEFNYNSKSSTFSVSISVNVIPKNNPKLQHQLLRFDLNGNHTNTQKNQNGTNKITGAHIHLFTKESNFIYSKNPTTSDAINLKTLYSMVKGKETNEYSNHPCVKNILDNVSSLELLRFNLLEQKLNKENYTDKEIHDILNKNKVKIFNVSNSNPKEICNLENVIIIGNQNAENWKYEYKSISKFLLCLDALKLMDNIVNESLNICSITNHINDKEYIEELKLQIDNEKSYNGKSVEQYLHTKELDDNEMKE